MASRLSSSPVSLKIELTKAGEKLLHLPFSTKGIIKSLLQTENILSRIALLSISIVKPLHVIREALISEDLVKHSDIAVKTSVACCICEILRIMAPNRPYDDKQMKEFFELVVTVFEKVSSSSGESYTRMIKVIETLSSGEFVAMMCDLQLDGLIERIFKRFLKAAESSSSDVVSKMEKMMTMIIKESEELPRELINLLAMSGKSKNEIASPVSVQLAKKVLKSYAAQLIPDNPDTPVNSEREKKTPAIIETPIPSKSVTTMNGKRKKQIQSDEHGGNLVGSKIKVWWPEDNTYYKGTVKSFDRGKKKHKVWYDDGEKESIDLKKQKWELVEEVQSAEHGENLVGSKIKVWWPADKSYYEGVVQSFDRSKMKHKVLYDDGDEDVLNLNERQWMLLEYVSTPVSELALPIKYLSLQAPAIKGSSTEALPKKVSSSQALPKEGFSTPAPQVPPEKVSSPPGSPKKGLRAHALPVKDLPAQAPARITRASLKMVRSTQVHPEEVPSPLALPIKDLSTQTLPIPDELELPIEFLSLQAPAIKGSSTEALPKKVSSSQTPPKEGSSTQLRPEKVPSTQVPPEKVQSFEPGENLVGEKIKVWWPLDNKYYEGVVESFDCSKKKHTVSYDDGDVESLDLKEQQWELVRKVGQASPPDDIISVQGYSVRQIIAPILEAIFNKHGDILVDCSFQLASVKTCFLEVICEIVKRIESSDVSTIISDMEEIESKVSQAAAVNINVSWLRDQLRITHTRNQALKKTASLKEMKVNTILVKRAARTDLMERCEELVVAQERCVKAEECIKVLDKRGDLVSDQPISTIISKRAARADVRERRRQREVAQEEFEKAERCVTILNLVEKKLSRDILESQCESTRLKQQII